MNMMFRLFERWVKITGLPDAQAVPPTGLVGFYWHFARQTKPVFVALFAIGFAVALLDVMIPVFIGHVVTLITQAHPAEIVAHYWRELAGMATPLIAIFVSYTLIALEAIASDIAEPFGLAPNNLALDAITNGIERSLLELCELELPPAATPVRAYHLT